MNPKMRTMFPRSIHDELGYYVYAYIDVSDSGEKYVYVGKGKADRCFSHLREAKRGDSEKDRTIFRLYKNDELRIDIIAHGLEEDAAEKVEASLIDVLRLHGIKNKKRGKGAAEYGRKSVDEIVAELQRDEISDLSYFKDNVVLIRLSDDYYSGMPDEELYERARGVWRASMENAGKASYALAVSGGIVREVYLIAGWFQGGSTAYWTRNSDPHDKEWKERIEFVGRIADEASRKRYHLKDVSSLYKDGEQNPIKYAGPEFNE